MGLNRLPKEKHSASVLWTVTRSGTQAAAIHHSTLTLYTLPTLSRSTHAISAAPIAIALRPAEASSDLPQNVTALSDGRIRLAGNTIAQLKTPIHLDYHAGSIAAVSHSQFIIFDAATGRSKGRHKLTAHAAAPTAVKLLDAESALVAGQLITLHGRGSVVSFSGHARSVSVMRVFNSRDRFITGSDDEFLFMWDAVKGATGSGKRARKIQPCGTLIAPEGGVVDIDVRECEDDSSNVLVACVLRSGRVAVWRGVGEGGSKGVKSTFVISQTEDSPLKSVYLSAFAQQGVLSVVYGNSMAPKVWDCDVRKVSQKELFLPAMDGNLLAGEEREGMGEKGRMRGAELMKEGLMVEGSGMNAVGPSRWKRKLNGMGESGGDGEAGDEEDGKGERDEDEDESENEDDEPSIQERLKGMGVSYGSGSQSEKIGSGLEGKQVDYGVRVLLQAIRARDSELFGRCIRSVSKREGIRRYVDEIPSNIAVGEFLELLVEQLRSYPKRAHCTMPWVREVMIEHGSALISQGRNEAMGSLLELVKRRTQSLEALSRLEGRLELVVGQAERLKRVSRDNGNLLMEARAEYVEEEGREGSESESGESESESAEDETGDFGSDEDSSDEEEDSDEEMGEANENGVVRSGKEKVGVGNGALLEPDDSSDSDHTLDV